VPTVETVRGPVDVDQLGRTLMHEHVFILTPDVMNNYGDGWWDEDERVTDAVAKFERVHALGITTIVDPTVVGLGRSIPRVARVAAQVELNIIVATGLYTFGEMPWIMHGQGPDTPFGGPEVLTDLFLRDLREGIGDTGVKAAFLKGVVEESGFTPDQTRVHRSIAEAHVETGAPITVHTNSAARTGLLALDFYEREGVDLRKVVVGHAGDSNDLDYLRALADRGATLGCDRFGNDNWNTTERRVEVIGKLCSEGYADRIVLSHDQSCFIDFYAFDAAREALAVSAPNWTFEHISRDVLPALLRAGVTEEQVDQMMVVNPLRYFTTS
jgi:phosphotriesterase-related protein